MFNRIRAAARVLAGKPLEQAGDPNETRYGDDRTMHGSMFVDVEVTAGGTVVSVWFRCMPLPFKQIFVDNQRMKEMEEMYERGCNKLKAVVMTS